MPEEVKLSVDLVKDVVDVVRWLDEVVVAARVTVYAVEPLNCRGASVNIVLGSTCVNMALSR